ncbi:hypothetical protein E4T39_04623 [Aureobasidium subglaciale]|nr:hypothetical protein E4T39_04623 [Aureobasidium subglaciale]
MAEGLEFVSTMIARYHVVERVYLVEESGLKEKLKQGIVKLYAAILRYLGVANTYYGKSKLIDAPKTAVESRHCEVGELLKLIDAESMTRWEPYS